MTNAKQMNMRKRAYLWISALLLLALGTSNCSSDDEEYSGNQVLGTWDLMSYENGKRGVTHYQEGTITVTFTLNGEMKVVNISPHQNPVPTGTFAYSFRPIDPQLNSGQSGDGIAIDSLGFYSYRVVDDRLELSAVATGGLGFSFKKVSK